MGTCYRYSYRGESLARLQLHLLNEFTLQCTLNSGSLPSCFWDFLQNSKSCLQDRLSLGLEVFAPRLRINGEIISTVEEVQ